jgi:two-component system response regulator AtoC
MPELSPEAAAVLQKYDYPGNVRELRNVLERALILETEPRITPSSLVLGRPLKHAATSAFLEVQLSEGKPPTLAELEKLYVERLLQHTGGNRAQAARLLDVSYPTVAKKIADYGIKLPE